MWGGKGDLITSLTKLKERAGAQRRRRVRFTLQQQVLLPAVLFLHTLGVGFGARRNLLQPGGHWSGQIFFAVCFVCFLNFLTYEEV